MESVKNKYSRRKLHDRSYRNLQHIAKTMDLPSNVKKAHLIDLIHAKECKSQEELNEIIEHVKLERRQRSALKRGKYLQKEKNYIQTSEVSSTVNKSPLITETPNRLNADIINHTNDVQQNLIKSNTYKSNATYPRNFRTYSAKTKLSASDRVLRSSRDRPNYGTMNADSVFDLMQLDRTPTIVNKVNRGASYPVFNLIAVDDKLVSVPSDIPGSSQLGPLSTDQIRPANERVRKLSGISPLVTPEKSQTYTRTMNFTHQNGKMTKLKAFVERPMSLINRDFSDISNSSLNNSNGINIILRLLKETEISNETNTAQQSNNQGANEKSIYTVDIIVEKSQNMPEENLTDPCNGYNEMRSDEMGDQQTFFIENSSEALPQIENDFSRFNEPSSRSLLKPIYVQVCENPEKTQTSPIYTTNESTVENSSYLENLYNFKRQYISSCDTLQHVATTSNTTCVYSTPVMTTAVQQTPSSVTNECNACDLLVQDNQYDGTTLYELTPFEEQDASSRNVFICSEVLNSSTLGTVNSQDTSVNAPLPQVVEDALDMISQDREYMERVAMHLCMQCFFCPWAGPKMLLESHLREDHMGDIETYESDEWVTTYTLGGLVQREVWLCRVVQRGAALYALSAKYEDPDIFMASVNSITAEGEKTSKLAQITAFNKVTGEPFTWEGPVEELPHTMPYYKDTDCFKLELSKMNLLPNSANLKLMNRELVVNSPTKVVVGQPALHDIHINVFIKLSDIVTLQK